jgi:mono/diheme cytochrome c family protein
MLDNVPTALTTLAFQDFLGPLQWILAASVGAVILVGLWGVLAPRRLPALVLVIPALLAMWQLSYFERVREFIRKPDIIEAYMYSNGLRASDYPLYAEEGLLAHASYASVSEVTDTNRLEAGREMFRLTCSRCHTTHGVNGVVEKLGAMYGWQEWDPATVRSYLGSMHNARPFMPPLPGTDAEKRALADYLVALRNDPAGLHGAQTHGVPRHDR